MGVSLPSFSIVTVYCAVMQIRVCHRLSIICTQKWVFEGEDVKMLHSKRHYPAWIRICWCIACQNQFNGLSCRSVERLCVETEKERNWVVNIGYMGRNNAISVNSYWASGPEPPTFWTTGLAHFLPNCFCTVHYHAGKKKFVRSHKPLNLAAARLIIKHT